MHKRWIMTGCAIALSACGKVADLEPAAGKALPQKPALAQRQLTAEELLALPPYARPDRIDELLTRGEPRTPDRFDLPPPNGAASPPPTPDNKAPSTTGPDNQDNPHS